MCEACLLAGDLYGPDKLREMLGQGTQTTSVQFQTVFGDDFSNDVQTTGVLSVGGSATGNIESPGDLDWFALPLTAGEWVEVELEGLSLSDTVLTVYDGNGNVIAFNGDRNDMLVFDSRVIFQVPTSGTYYVQASGFQTATGTYQLSASKYTPPAYDPLDTISWGAKLSDTNVTVYFGVAGYTEDGLTSEGFTAYEIARFQAAFDLIESVSGVTFTVVSAPSNADFRLLLDTNEMGNTSLGYFWPPATLTAGFGAFNGAYWDRGTPDSARSDLEVGSLGFQVITHELLHGLGFAHSHDPGGSSSIMPGVYDAFGSYGVHGLNQGVFTAMSYNGGYATGDAGQQIDPNQLYGYDAGPMALDIALLQQLYGANTSTAAGNDTYVLADFNGSGTHWQAIWDTGGQDEIVYSGSRNTVIDLRAATLLGAYGGGGFVSAAAGVAGGFTIANGVVIEGAQSGSGDDTLRGNGADNTLVGGSGDDILSGGAGNDTLIGGGDDDTLNGGSSDVLSNADGADRFIGGAGRDWVSYEGSFGSLLVDLLFSTINTFAAAGDTYDSIENLIGSQGFDNLRGTHGDNHIIGGRNVDYIFGRQGNDTLEGGIGNDALFGGPGADVLDGGANMDRAQYSQSATGLLLDLMNPGLNTGEAAGDTYISIEGLAGSEFTDQIFGDTGANQLFGRGGADRIYGRNGDDYLNGGAQADRLDGGLGNDTLRGGTHNDTFVFNGGVDVVEDYNPAHADRIAIDDDFITAVAGMNGNQVVANFATASGGQVVFDFGGGNTLTLENTNSTVGLGDDVLVF